MSELNSRVDDNVLTTADGHKIMVDTPDWSTWLDTATSFAFVGRHGTFTARKEQRGSSGWYWKAYRKQNRRLRAVYLGKSAYLSLHRLETAARELALAGSADRAVLEDHQFSSRNMVEKVDEVRGSRTKKTGTTSSRAGVVAASPAVITSLALPGTPGGRSDYLIETKLRMPLVRSDVIRRERLLTRLDEGLTETLTVICAPAGFGKTTLLAYWLQHSGHWGRSFAWLSLDESDNDIARFVRYLVAALRTFSGSLGEATLALLQAPQPAQPTEPLEPASLLSPLLNELNTLQGEYVLVIDDYHVVQNPSIHRLITLLLKYAPRQLRLVIATRESLPLPLGRMRASGTVCEMATGDLCFNNQETASFLRITMGLDLSPEVVAALASRTEGWIAGIQLEALSIKTGAANAELIIDQGGIASAGNAREGTENRYILDYLAEEVLSRQSEDVREFLLYTSILDHLNGDLCDALLGTETYQTDQKGKEEEAEKVGMSASGARISEGSHAMLRQLETRNLFITPLDQERHWYRYHHLFAGFLRSYLAQTQPGKAAELHRRAALWYRRRGIITEAVRHALHSTDSSLAADLIEQSSRDMLRYGELATLLKWLRALPDDVVSMRPSLCLAFGWALALTGSLDEVEPYVQQAERGVEEDPSLALQLVRTLRGEVDTIRATVALFRGDSAATVALAGQALEYLPADENFLRSFVTLWLGGTLYRNGNKSAGGLLAEAARMSRASGNMQAAILAMDHLARLQMERGRLQQAAAIFCEALYSVIRSSEQTPAVAGLLYVGMGELLYEWNDLSGAEHHLTRGLELCARYGNVGALLGAYRGMARLKGARADWAGALALVQRAEQLAREQDTTASTSSAMLSAFRVQMRLEQGDIAGALRWAQQSAIAAHADAQVEAAVGARSNVGSNAGARALQEIEYLTLARIFIANDKGDIAIPLLGGLYERANGEERVSSLVEILALQSLAHESAGRNVAARETLELTLALAAPGGYVRTLLDMGAPMFNLLRSLTRSRASMQKLSSLGVRDYTRVLMRALRQESASREVETVRSHLCGHEGNGSRPTEFALLTSREREVLRLVADGLTNQAIARKMVVQVSTVKTHINSLYSKLDVRTRLQAVERARWLGLLT